MSQVMMVKRQCVCGEWDNVTLVTGNVPLGKKYYYVKCPGCGRQTAKHTGAEEAVREWNHMEDVQDDCSSGN